jgi:SAM-dependent methyltransferase
MSYGWIDARQFSFNTLLLMDRWIFREIVKNQNQAFQKKLGLALAENPVVLWYILNKCPEMADRYRSIAESASANPSPEEVRECEIYVLNAIDWAVVYMYPEIMENLPYIKDWNPERLISITDFNDKIVLDIGAGTGRLTFAVSSLAKAVYAIEPVDRLRAYIREKARHLNLDNVYASDGMIERLSFASETFDIVMSGHVLGDNYTAEYEEMNRVTKPGGYFVDCPGEDDRKKPEGPSIEMIRLGFEYTHYISNKGGDVYRYWKQKSTPKRACDLPISL